ncbi:MAG: MarR family winged helix-turn-helix transcriptional regulator [Terasakiella sp.]|uniref:MarR family winged helix-turn-helix transcriptional regulator n=1 Tax=unclassified Terasakiella TaxID=2614952 RepID=UPI003AFFCCE5
MINQKQNIVPLLVHDVAHQLRVIIDGKVSPYNLTRQIWVALSLLEESPGISQIELAARLEIDRSSAGRLLDRMEKKELIHRLKDAQDRRIVRLYLNEEARPLLEKLDTVSHEIKSVAENGLTQEEQYDLVRLLRKVKTNLKAGFGSFCYLFELPEQAYWMMNLL